MDITFDNSLNFHARYPYKLPRDDGYKPIDNVTIEQTLVIDFYNSIYGDATNFTTMLFRLLHKADRSNKKRLSVVFPKEVFMCWLWENEYLSYAVLQTATHTNKNILIKEIE